MSLASQGRVTAAKYIQWLVPSVCNKEFKTHVLAENKGFW